MHSPVQTCTLQNKRVLVTKANMKWQFESIFLTHPAHCCEEGLYSENETHIQILLCAQRAHWWEFYVPRGDFMCPSQDWNLDNSNCFQDIRTKWTPVPYIFKELSNDTTTYQFDQYEDDFPQKIIYELKINNMLTGHLIYCAPFYHNNAPWGHGRGQCESLELAQALRNIALGGSRSLGLMQSATPTRMWTEVLSLLDSGLAISQQDCYSEISNMLRFCYY